MARAWSHSAKKGLGYGIVAGIVFAIAEVAASAIMGNPALMPVRMFASVVLGQSAMETVPLGTVLFVGVLAHVVLSALFGLVYGLVNARLSLETRSNVGRQAAIGLGFGAIVWLVNFQIIARALYPWFLGAPQLLQLVLHAVAFGLPLGLMYAAGERRVAGMRREVPAT